LEPCARADDAELQALLRSAYPAAATKLEQPIANLTCSGRLKFETRGNAREEQLLEGPLQLVTKGISRLSVLRYERQNPPTGVAATVRCKSPRYGFKLRQQVQGVPFVIVDLVRPRDEVKAFDAEVSTYIDTYVCAAFKPGDVSIRDLLADDRAKIVKALLDDPEGSLEVSFDLRNTNTGCLFGRVVLDMNLDWCVREYEFLIQDDPQWRSVQKGSVECQRWQPGAFVFPIVVRDVVTSGTPDNTRYVTDETIVDFDDVTLNSAKESQFTFAAFGLPDPTAPRRSYYPFDNWLFWAFVVAAVTSAALLRRWRRRAT
jgi:hypothetical protein